MMKKVCLLIMLVLMAGGAHARMYQWTDPDTGTTQLSGKPPHWYRSDQPGPRIIVFDGNRVVDDTGIIVSAPESERLRRDALLLSEQDRARAMEKLMEAERRKAALAGNADDAEELLPTEPVVSREATPAPEPNDAAVEAPTAEQMRALLEQYEQMRTRDARQLIEGTAGGRE